LIQFLAIIIGVLLSIIVVIYATQYVYLFIGLLLCYAFFYSRKKRRAYSKENGSKLKYGDIIMECTKCGSSEIVKENTAKNNKSNSIGSAN